MKIKDPLIELLAIKLFEHDHPEWPPNNHGNGWMKMADEDRELYRQMARGKEPIPSR